MSHNCCLLHSAATVLDLAGLDVRVELLEGVGPRPAAAAGEHQKLRAGVVIALLLFIVDYDIMNDSNNIEC